MALRLPLRQTLRASQSRAPIIHQLRAATTSSLPKDTPASRRRSITVVSDTGQVPWKSLSVGEKAARTTQQTFNLGLILLGVGLTGTVAYVLYLEVFSTDSKVAVFNRAADRVRKDPKCIELLAGNDGMRHTKREISAYDRAGVEHIHMHFYVEGPAAKGTVNLHMSRMPGQKDFEYRVLALDVPGQQRVYLENRDGEKLDQRKQGKMFGVRWN
ncbi:mitochondrial import inner membrane translocase subunit tim21 [Elasticomyces elasticus]|nr:mitochondrial import inner membrane translocase subunit tim21 [Elasticomyces elasticus]KAK3655456.1 mitochondrial import inner membrane translocase subunit tim21 [Elasticomyces elasticus]KAK5756711.1 mitochondrial import inner membrane translocase subunit tim21 [Elasticomyces elasticus]